MKTSNKTFTVIAHRGACGYLPEHTLEGAAMAHAMGAEYIEQDVLMTRDDELIVLHDLYLDAVTDVAGRFPGRGRGDGRFYAIDFTLAEIKKLRVHERVTAVDLPAFPGRFPVGKNLFSVPTLEEEISLIQGLNKSTGRNVGLYIEPKSPAWHEREGKDLIGSVIGLLAKHGYTGRNASIYLQSFDMDALKRARFEFNTDLKLVQLIGENSWEESEADFDYLRSEKGLEEIARFADGIGPWLPQVVETSADGSADISDLTELAHRFGLLVHAYTLRADQLPSAVGDMATALRILIEQCGLDGVFTDHPDQVVRYLRADRKTWENSREPGV